MCFLIFIAFWILKYVKTININFLLSYKNITFIEKVINYQYMSILFSVFSYVQKQKELKIKKNFRFN